MATTPGGGGAALSYAQLEGVWLEASQGTKYHTRAWAALMAAVATAESGGNPDATNPHDNGGAQTSWGLWQISNGTHGAVSPTWNNPYTNARLAIGKLDSQGLRAWGTYDSGAYKAYMSGSTTPTVTGIGSKPQYLTAAETAATEHAADCIYQVSWGGVLGVGGFNACLLYKSQARAVIGGTLIVAGGVVLLAGAGSLAAIASAKYAAPVLAAAKATPGAGLLLAAAGSRAGASSPPAGGDDAAARQEREEIAHERHTANQYRKQRRARENMSRDDEREEIVPF